MINLFITLKSRHTPALKRKIAPRTKSLRNIILLTIILPLIPQHIQARRVTGYAPQENAKIITEPSQEQLDRTIKYSGMACHLSLASVNNGYALIKDDDTTTKDRRFTFCNFSGFAAIEGNILFLQDFLIGFGGGIGFMLGKVEKNDTVDVMYPTYGNVQGTRGAVTNLTMSKDRFLYGGFLKFGYILYSLKLIPYIKVTGDFLNFTCESFDVEKKSVKKYQASGLNFAVGGGVEYRINKLLSAAVEYTCGISSNVKSTDPLFGSADEIKHKIRSSMSCIKLSFIVRP